MSVKTNILDQIATAKDTLSKKEVINLFRELSLLFDIEASEVENDLIENGEKESLETKSSTQKSGLSNNCVITSGKYPCDQTKICYDDCEDECDNECDANCGALYGTDYVSDSKGICCDNMVLCSDKAIPLKGNCDVAVAGSNIIAKDYSNNVISVDKNYLCNVKTALS